MKKLAIAALVVTLLAGGVLTYGFAMAKLAVTPLSVQVHSAADQPLEFERLKQAVGNRSLVGTLYQQHPLGEAKDYSLVVYTVQLRNRGLVQADMAELLVNPTPEDLLCYTDGSAQGTVPAVTVSPGETKAIRCVLLTRNAQRMSAGRDLVLSYHVWGNSYTTKLRMAPSGSPP